MVAKMPYKSLNHALRLMREQILEGLQYAAEECPKFNTPEEIFEWLKLRTTYKSDPQGIELFMTLPTFLDSKKNYWKKSGAGDCDDFTIAALTLLLANGFFNSGIVLVGRTNYNAVHIYAYTITKDKKTLYLDLTNSNFNYERKYNYRQEIPFILTTKEKNQIIKNMQLQLAEGYTLLSKRSPKKAAARKETRQAAKAQRINIAPRPSMNYYTPAVEVVETQPEIAPEQIDNNYIYLPSTEMYVREDLGDNMPYIEWSRGLSSEGYTPSEISELSAKRKERKEEKRRLKTEKKEAKTDIKKSKADARRTKAEAKATRAEKKGSGRGAEIFKDVLDTAKEYLPKPKGAEAAAATETEKDETASDKIFGMPKMVAYGLGALLIGGGIYAATRPKNK